MKLRHRIYMLLGIGPKFVLAEAGSDPLAEPELYKTRRRRGLKWLPYVLGLLGMAGAWAAWWFTRAR